MMTRSLRLWVGAAVLVASAFIARPAVAENPKPTIRDEAYQASFVSQSLRDPIVLEAGEKKTVTVTFKNTGAIAWAASGSRFVSAYTMEPRDRTSAFVSTGWKSAKQTGAIAKAAKPGETTTLSIELKAPTEAGDYTEEFYLAAENYSWIQGGYFFFKITVLPKKESIAKKTTADAPVPSTSAPYKAKQFMQNKKVVSVAGGERIQLMVAFQNTGKETWKEYGLAPTQTSALAGVSQKLSFADELWQNSELVFTRPMEVLPGGVVTEEFYFRAPPTKGQHTARFRLQVNGTTLDDVYAQVTVDVTSDAPDHVPSVEEAPLPVNYRLAEEPRIRVGIWKPAGEVQVVSYQDDYTVYDGDIAQGVLPKGRVAFIRYESGNYFFQAGSLTLATPSYVRLSPVNDPHAIFTLLNYDHPVTWKGPNNFNTYRGALEYRLTQDGKTHYIINELLFEDYVKGIAENGNSSPEEYLKAQSVAQRTYAFYVKDQSDKHDKRNFDVISTTGDQLYLGYESERIMPRFVAAAEATRGQMVTHNGSIVITPYFGNSNGQTKSWVQVWGGTPKPWLVPVKAEYDKGRRLFGHGVGMSQRDAALRAEKEGLGWQELLKHYYTGTEAEKIYQ